MALDAAPDNPPAEMRTRIRTFDWSATPLGPSGDWPPELRNAVEACLDSETPAILWWGADFVAVYNDACRSTLGPKHPTALGSPARTIWPETWSVLEPLLAAVRARGEPQLQADLPWFSNRCGCLEERYVTLAGAPLRDAAGAVAGVHMLVNDTTARVVGERRLRTLQAFALRGPGPESAADICERIGAIFAGNLHDLPFTALYLADDARGDLHLGCRTGEIPADLIPEQSSFEELGRRWPLAQAARRDRSVLVENFRVANDDGAAPPWADPDGRVLVMPLHSSGRAPALGFLMVGINPRLEFDDAQRAFMEQLARQVTAALSDAQAYRALREAERRKNEFLAILAHELRNPLAPVRNAAAILASEALPSKQRAWCVDVIQRQTQQMALLLDDLLDASRVTLGRLHLKKEPIDVAAIVQSALETAQPMIDARRHRLILDLPQKPLTLEADPLRIAQVLANLLTNAAKYMDPGGTIHLTARQIDHAVELAVADTGIGLGPADLDRVFTMFSQVDSVIDRSQGGLGIGLALVKGLVELHGGTIRAQSDGLGYGSQFTVQLPGLLPPTEPEAPTAAVGAAPGPSARIVVADDNRDAADSLAMFFELNGHQVRTAGNGAEALELIAAFDPQVAFIDIGMPVINGLEVARRVRQRTGGGTIRLVALTGWGQDDNKRQAEESGFDHHVTKPVDPHELDRLLTRLLDPGRRG